MTKYFAIFLLLLSAPVLTHGAQPKDFKSFVDVIIGIVSTLTTVVFVLTVFAIMWGVIKGWIVNGGSDEGVESGKRVAFIGVVVLVLTTALWGILALLQGSFT
jgi:hypothetical protein